MTPNPYWPKFLRSPDPDLDPDYLRRAAYAYPHRESADRPFTVNYGYGLMVFTVEDALAWAERRADEVLRASE